MLCWAGGAVQLVEGVASRQQVPWFDAQKSINPARWYRPAVSHSDVEARDSAGIGKEALDDDMLKLVNKYLKIKQ